MIGVSASALQRIELGTLALSAAVARRIHEVTAVDVTCLTAEDRPLKDTWGNNYSREHFDECQLRFRSKAMKHECEYMIEEFCGRIRILLSAAALRRCFPLLASDLWTELDKLRKTYGLTRLTDELIRQSSSRSRQKWQDITSPDTVVWFDDNQRHVFSLSEAMGTVLSHLSISSESIGYGLSNDGFLFTFRHKPAASEQSRGPDASVPRRRNQTVPAASDKKRRSSARQRRV